MRPLSFLGREEARRLRGLVFDLDDTLLDHGALSEEAYASLFRMREAGLLLVPCTGRPAGWGEVVQRQWPVSATIAENGAAVLLGGQRGLPLERVVAPGDLPRRELVALAESLCARHPEAALADDNAARLTDVTIDIGEHRRVAPEVVVAMRAEAEARGARTFASSVHLHLTTVREDKASGAVRALARLGEDPGSARFAFGFVGDSTNDAPAFAAFSTTFGVANVARFLDRFTVPPRYLAPSPMGTGFAEIASHLVALRRA